MFSVDFAEIEKLQHEGNWSEATHMMTDAALRLERGGADFIVICTNTMHKMAEDVEKAVRIPLLHIADATAQEIQRQGLSRVGLLGTRFTMEEDFYKGRLTKNHGLEVLIPDQAERETVHRVIYQELVAGVIKDASRKQFSAVIDTLVKRGAQGVILGCTEIGLLVKQADSPVPLFDTTEIHARAAVEFALKAG